VQPWTSCLHTCASVTKQHNLVPVNGQWCSAAGEVTAGLAESNGSLPPGLWLQLPAGWLPRTGISCGTLCPFRVRDLQGAPIKNNPLEKILYLRNYSRFFHQIYAVYRGGFRPCIQQIPFKYLVWFQNYNYLNLKVHFSK